MLNYAPDELKKLQARHRVLASWEKKYGEPVPRVVASFLLTAQPDAIVRRFGGNPGLHVVRQELDEVLGTSGMAGEWEQTAFSPVEPDEWPEFSGDPKSLAERMVPIYRQAFEEVRKRKPTAAELEMVMAVGRSETVWGTAPFPGGTGIGAKNHGAVQCHKNCDETNSFEASDTHPLDGGGSQRYVVRFRRYPSDLEGAKGLIKSVGNDPLRMLAQHGNLVAAFSLGMFGNRYYEMFNATPKLLRERADVYEWIRRNAARPPPKTTESFRFYMARAKEPNWAGRVLMHAVAIDKNAAAIAKSLGVARATKALPQAVSSREVAGAGVGALVGLLAFGGPIGAGVGAVAGLAAGRALR